MQTQTPSQALDPESIRIDTRHCSWGTLIDQADNGAIELAPYFRHRPAWSRAVKSRLIESILLQIPSQSVYLAEDRSGTYRVVDGWQRLSTLHEFARGNQLALEGLQYLPNLEGKRHGDLTPTLRRRISNTPIVMHVIAPTTPDDVMHSIVNRIQTW